MIKEGHIPYLKKWSNPQQSAEINPNKKTLQEDDIHSNIQRLCPRGPKQLMTCKNWPTLTIQGSLHRSQISNSQATNLQRDDELADVEVQD